MSSPVVGPVAPPPSRRSRVRARVAAAPTLTAAGLTLRVSLRTPALRWAAAVLVAVAGRCTVQARFESMPVAGPAPVAVPDVSVSDVEVVP